MIYCIHSSPIRPKTKLDNGFVKWAKLVDSVDINVNNYTSNDEMLVLKYNPVDLWKYLM